MGTVAQHIETLINTMMAQAANNEMNAKLACDLYVVLNEYKKEKEKQPPVLFFEGLKAKEFDDSLKIKLSDIAIGLDYVCGQTLELE